MKVIILGLFLAFSSMSASADLLEVSTSDLIFAEAAIVCSPVPEDEFLACVSYYLGMEEKELEDAMKLNGHSSS